MVPSVLNVIERLPKLRIPVLQEEYQRVFGEPPPSQNKQFLYRRIAWRLQANEQGGLSPQDLRRIEEIADTAVIRLRPPRNNRVPFPVLPPVLDLHRPQRDWRLPPPGSVLTRRHKKRQIVVQVLEDGFEFDSRSYSSLGAIAREVTGTRWNGLLFFGLTERNHAR